jgi:vacuolar protein sorting-associated protein 35
VCLTLCDPVSTGISVALKKLFQFLHQTTQALAEIPRAEAALRLYLQCAQAASDCNLEPVTYEFMERAYEIFEESIPGEQTRLARLLWIAHPYSFRLASQIQRLK